MSSVVRDTPLSTPDEPLPPFRDKLTRRGAVLLFLRLFVPAVALAFCADPWRELAVYGWLVLAPYAVAAVLLLLERPVRAWMDRRYARRVARGLLELEELGSSSR